jgi:hypothetical protein
MKKLFSAEKGDSIPDPYGQCSAGVELLARTMAGISFRHPKRGLCGMRFDSMTTEEKSRLETVMEI